MLRGLSPESRERIIQAVYAYLDFGATPDFSDYELIFWGSVKTELDKQKAKNEKRKVAGKAGAVARWQKNTKEKPPKKTEPKKTEKKFKKPTIDEISEFVKENSLIVDCVKFWNYYESNGWKVGRNPMKDWKATLRNWNRNSIEWGKAEIKPPENKKGYEELL